MVAGSGAASVARTARYLNQPRPAHVRAEHGIPVEVGRVPVANALEEWRVVDAWWTEAPVQRRYFELVLETGEHAVVFFDETAGRWFRQRG